MTITPPFPAILIDEELLESLRKNSCYVAERRVRYCGQGLPHFLRQLYKNHSKVGQLLIHCVFSVQFGAVFRFAVNASGNLSIPRDPKMFSEYWRRSKFVNCLGLSVKRSSNSHYLPVRKTIQEMSSLIRYLTSYGVFAFLDGGSLLGMCSSASIVFFSNALGP
ncbi:unnamed protein product [Heligmosomoides polygyrus]|uniref:Uncharacterized protein n=1 Tax=Heligmosomoides polygyrus TaxID=6339 RepID=A0A183FEX8_HELPZ|nr:unnamed protein product [Heligmosomoides polygyrus]